MQYAKLDDTDNDIISIDVLPKSKTSTEWKCLLTFTSSDLNNKIKYIKYPSDENNIIKVENPDGKEKVAIDYIVKLDDLNKVFEIETINGKKEEESIANHVNYYSSNGVIYKADYRLKGDTSSFKVINTSPTQAGKHFIGWSYNKNMTEEEYQNSDLVLDGEKEVSGATLTKSNLLYEFGDKDNDVATSSSYAKNMVILKVNGNLTINNGVTVTACKSDNGYGGPKGLLIYATGSLYNNGTIDMTARGAYAVGQNVYLWNNGGSSYEYVPATGASGGAAVTINNAQDVQGADGGNGTLRKTGGGGAGSYGYSGSNGTGGLFIGYGKTFINKGYMYSRGSMGGSNSSGGYMGGCSGGGSINIFYKTNFKTNTTIDCYGGNHWNKQTRKNYDSYNKKTIWNDAVHNSAGGDGCVTIGTISSGPFVKVDQ